MTRELQHRHNNGYDTILLVDTDTDCVIGEWTVGADGKELDSFNNPGDLADWEPTYPENEDPEDYGDLVETKAGTKSDSGKFVVAHHYQSHCKIVSEHTSRSEAVRECERLNQEEEESNAGSGHYFTTDAND